MNQPIYIPTLGFTKLSNNLSITLGKTTFLMTNSPFDIVNAGMIYMLGQDWRRLFDVIIVNAKKPSFFSAKKRHFRVFSSRTGRLKWQRVVNLQRGKIYSGVSFDQKF